MQLVLSLLSFFTFLRFTPGVHGAPPSIIYGVNLGSWLVLEPWMLPEEWVNMGGERCDNDCSSCIASEFAFAAAYPDDVVDERFAVHWSTWFSQDDVNNLKDAGINSVRIPLGYWIVEPLVTRATEHYPRGGMNYLANGLDMLRKAGIHAILDHHALPGVQVANQMFTGNCTSTPQFYTDYNYGRALIWTAVMTFMSQLHPQFDSVFSIQAVNEPIMNATQTPGLGDYQKNFVRTVRAVEWLIGIEVQGYPALEGTPNANSLEERLAQASAMDTSGLFTPPVIEALTASFPMLFYITQELQWTIDFTAGRGRLPIVTNFMDILWQHDNPPNPSDAAIGPQAYDHHLYYRLGVAPANPEAYLQNLCNRDDVQRDTQERNVPVWYGEWSLATQFDATDDFLRKWADAQKLIYSQRSVGWLFWNFKMESTNPLARQWSYFEGLERGYLTKDPSQLHDPDVCVPYRATSYVTSSSSTSSRRDNASRRDNTVSANLLRSAWSHKFSRPIRIH